MDMKLCECGCGKECKNRFINGHNRNGTKWNDKQRENIPSKCSETKLQKWKNGEYKLNSGIWKDGHEPWNKYLPKEQQPGYKKEQTEKQKEAFAKGRGEYKKNGKNISCLNCNKEFYVSEIRSRSAKFCSYSCNIEFKIKTNVVEKECLQCKNIMMLKSFAAEHRLFCGLSCSNKYKWNQEEYRKKNIESHLGQEAWNKGINIWENKEHPRGMKGKENKWGKHTEETKKIFREQRKYRIFPIKDTKIEVSIQNELKNRNIIFEKHKPILGQPDIFIQPNICIFADGNYWHKYPNHTERDIFVTNKLQEENYLVLRYWESEINNNVEGVVDEIEDVLLQQKNLSAYKEVN